MIKDVDELMNILPLIRYGKKPRMDYRNGNMLFDIWDRFICEFLYEDVAQSPIHDLNRFELDLLIILMNDEYNSYVNELCYYLNHG